MILDSDIEARDELCGRIARINKFIMAASLAPYYQMLQLRLCLYEKRETLDSKPYPFYLEIWTTHLPKNVVIPSAFGNTLEQAATKLLDAELLSYWEAQMVSIINKQSKLLKTLKKIFQSKLTRA